MASADLSTRYIRSDEHREVGRECGKTESGKLILNTWAVGSWEFRARTLHEGGGVTFK